MDSDRDEYSGDGEDLISDSGVIFLRFSLVLKRRWKKVLADKNSDEFSKMAEKLRIEIEKLFKNVPGRQEATVASFR